MLGSSKTFHPRGRKRSCQVVPPREMEMHQEGRPCLLSNEVISAPRFLRAFSTRITNFCSSSVKQTVQMYLPLPTLVWSYLSFQAPGSHRQTAFLRLCRLREYRAGRPHPSERPEVLPSGL